MNGSIRQRSKGTWQLRYDAPPDGTGKRRFVSETVKGNKKDAERVLRERLAAVETGNYVTRDKETVAEYLNHWLGTYAASNTTLRTQQGYLGNIRRYIEPSIGSIELQKLKPDQIQKLYVGLLEKGLGNRTVLHVHRVLRKALSDGVKWGVLVRNVADAATPPRPQNKEMEMWDTDTISEFIAITEGHRFRDFYLLALLTGLRRSELCGVKWESVDLVAGRLSVVRTLQRIDGKGLVEGQPKTRKSRRSIALSPQAVEVLHAVRGQQIEYQLAAGPLWRNTGYVLTQADGSPLNPITVTQKFTAIVRESNLPHLTLHGLRHAHATLMLTAGVHPKVVSERLGHSNIAITMDTYSHVMPGLQEEAVLTLDAQININPVSGIK
ncbi:MAG: tyrosine-type recombinase/integrase [Chloroflexi bacterium]|nr:tyrosine-type recombinase/integrase [Chloroflexota bacterium]